MNLQAAIDAVRAESTERGIGHRATRGRVVASIERSPRRRLHAAVAAVIASMFGASAFAWYARAPHHVAPPTVAEVSVPPPVVEVVAPVERTVARTRVEPPAAIEPEPLLQVAPAAPLAEAAASSTTPAPPVRDSELELYAAAHHLHFQAKDLIGALAAWDRYLAASPNGTLAPEARFNRLVVLVRLRRWDEATRSVEDLDPTFRADDVTRLRELIGKHAPQ